MSNILIINSNFYPEISAELLQGAAAVLEESNATYEVIEAPGAFEIPGAIGFALQAEINTENRKYDGYIALGCVIRGETSHYDYVCGESARGLNDLAMNYNAAIGYGILTVEGMAQAKKRADRSRGNKGGMAAKACLEMIKLKQKFL